MKKILLFFAALVASSLFLIQPPVKANVNNFYFSEFSADYYLYKDEEGIGNLRVKETLVAEFPDYEQNKGIVRAIPTANFGGRNVVFTKSDAQKAIITRNGEPEPIYSIDDAGETINVSTGTEEYITGQQTFIFEYEFKKVITDFDTGQELYWDTNGTGWSQAFENISVRVHLDEEIKDYYRGEKTCYFGNSGSLDSDKCTTSYDEESGVFEFASLTRATYGQNLSFVIGFNSGSFVIPPQEKSYKAFAVAMVFIGVSVLSFIIALVTLIKVKKRKEAYSKFVKPEYLPPEGVSVLEAGHVYDGTISYPAQLIDLAVRGNIKLIEKPTGPLNSKKYFIEFVNAHGLNKNELSFLAIVLSGDMSVGSTHEVGGSDKSVTRTALVGYEKKLIESICENGYEKKQKTNLSIGSFFALFFAFALFMIVALFESRDGNLVLGENGAEAFAPWLFWVSLGVVVATLIIVSVMSGYSSRYSKVEAKGYDLINYLQGLEMYIELAEADRIKFLQSVESAERIPVDDSQVMIKLYEKLLPYAMLFDLERTWEKQLQSYYETVPNYSPSWYVGSSVFDSAAFGRTISSFNRSVGSSYTYSGGSSSGSSGFSGGGGSGGGGGGGGGGGR